MPTLRIKPDWPITYYHVMTRTSQKAFLLQDPAFKEEVTRIIHTFAQIYYVEVQAWVIMDNHVHLGLKILKPEPDVTDLKRRFQLLQAQLKHSQKWRDWYKNKYYQRLTNLSAFMWEINRRIAVSFNRQQHTWGHFWGARFKSKVVENEDAMMRVLSYIEQNPVRAGLVAKPSDYVHSSVGRIKQDIERGRAPKAPKLAWLRDLLEKDRAPAYLAWNDYLALMLHRPEKAMVLLLRSLLRLLRTKTSGKLVPNYVGEARLAGLRRVTGHLDSRQG